MQRIPELPSQGKILADFCSIALIILLLQNWVYPSVFLLTLSITFVCWFLSARTLGLYKDFRNRPFSIEATAFVKAMILYTLVMSFVTFQIFNQFPFSRRELFFHCAAMFLVLPVQKLAIRIALKKMRNRDGARRKVLIVGAGKTGVNFYQQYVKNKHYGLELAGFVDDVRNTSLNGHYLGTTKEIDRVIANHELDEIVVALPITQESQIEHIVSLGEKEGKRIRIIPDYQRFGTGRMRIDRVGTMPMITLRSLPLDVIDNRIYKRIFDVFFSVLVITLLMSWLLPIISIIIKATSKGPVFFKQERWGLNNKIIVCYKFRSMVACSKDVDEAGNYQQASRNDPRITPIGAFLRKTNLDELPQFFNVLLGSMSIVGPRPHPVPLNLASKNSVENYMMRHWVKPGITGWAQVNGYRGETKVPFLMQKRVELDVWYIENWTFWLDLQIILQTITNMIKGEKNAF